MWQSAIDTGLSFVLSNNNAKKRHEEQSVLNEPQNNADCYCLFRTSSTFKAEFIHLKYAFKAARRATVSLASIFRTRNNPSFSKLAEERKVVGFFDSGLRELNTVSRCFLEGSLMRIVAFAFVRLPSERIWRLSCRFRQKLGI
jgi:hypothetical protein